MILTLREHVIANRAGVVLYNSGVKPVRTAIESVEKTLRAREKMVEEDKASVQAEYEEVKKFLDEFSAETNELLSLQLPESIVKTLADDYYEYIVEGSIEEAAKEAAPKVFDATGIVSNIGDFIERGFDFFLDIEHEGIDKKCAKIIADSYRKAVQLRGTAWLEHLEDRAAYKDHFSNHVLDIQESLKKSWEELKQELNLSDNTMLAEIPPPVEVSGEIRKDITRKDVKDVVFSDTTVAARFQIVSALQMLAFSVAASFAGYALFNYTILMFIPGGQFIAVAIAAVGLLSKIFEDEEEKKREVSQEIKKQLLNSINNSKEDIKNSIIKGDPTASEPQPGLKHIRDFYISFFKGTLEKQKAALENIHKERLKNLEMDKDEKERVCQKAEQWRTERIELLRKDLAKVEKEIKEIFGEGETTA